MAENEIKILISAVDDATATLKKIEGQMGIMQKEIAKSTDKAAKSTDDQIGSFIRLGAAANSLDNIMSSYQNLQLRLENSAERVANAQDRVTDAQDKLNKLTKDGKSKTDDYIQAQKELERASRSLTIAENNQSRAQNAVLGIYINMAVQGLVLVKSYSELKLALDKATASALKFIATPIGATITAVALVLITAKAALDQHNKSVEETRKAWEDYQIAVNRAKDTQRDFNEALDYSYNKIKGLLGAKSERQAYLEYEIADLTLRSKTETNAKIVEGMNSQIKKDELELSGINDVNEVLVKKLEYLKIANSTSQEQITVNGLVTASYQEQLNWLTGTFYAELINKANELKLANEAAVAALYKQATAKSDRLKSMTGSTNKYLPSSISGAINQGSVTMSKIGKKRNDFIMRPGQPAVPFSSDDTVVGVKGGLGNSIVITGNIYGVNPDQIADAIMSKLRKKIAL